MPEVFHPGWEAQVAPATIGKQRTAAYDRERSPAAASGAEPTKDDVPPKAAFNSHPIAAM